MRLAVLLLLLLGCPRPAVVPTPSGASDGDVISPAGPARLALVADLDGRQEPLADVRAHDPTLVLLAGDAVSRGTPGAWRQLTEDTRGLPVLALPADGERTRDADLEVFADAWEGLGVIGVERPVPWRHVDVMTEGVRWRLVLIDADREALGDRWRDQLFWVPKAVGDRTWDHLLVVTSHAPRSLTEGAEVRRGLVELREIIDEHARPGGVVAWLAGGEGSTELLLPEGRWNAAELVAGCSGGGGARTLRRGAADLALPDGLQRALIDEFWAWRSNGALDPTPLEEGADFTVPGFPVCGWWQIELEGAALEAQLRMPRYREGWRAVWTATWSPANGWRTQE